MTRVALALAAAVLALAATANAAAPTLRDAAIMVVPIVDSAAEYKIQLSSGPTDNERAADTSFDPADTAATITKAGRLYGYALTYGIPSQTSLKRGSGFVDIGTSVDVFKSPALAKAYGAKTLADLTRFLHKKIDGLTIEEVSRFPVTGFGPDAVGVRVKILLGALPLYGTYVDFRAGHVLAEAAITQADEGYSEERVIALALKLKERVDKTLAGTLKSVPLPLPRPQGKPGPPTKGPALDQLALRTQDVTANGQLVRSEYVKNDNALSSFTREFQLDPSKSDLLAVKDNVELLRSPEEASGTLFVLRSLFGGKAAHETISNSFGLGTQVKTSEARLDSAGPAGVGHESYQVSVSFKVAGVPQRIRIVILYVRVGRVLTTLILTGRSAGFGVANAKSIGKTAAARVEAKMAKGPPLVA